MSWERRCQNVALRHYKTITILQHQITNKSHRKTS